MPTDKLETETKSKFLLEVCNGNQDAVTFLDLWVVYCHGIDDLIDTKEDGRPTLPNQTIIELFVLAAMIYNNEFYVANRHHLFPIVLAISNLYADSVEFERAPEEHKRKIADVIRNCGQEMFMAVALLCGGWSNLRKYSGAIREHGWKVQH